MSIGRLWVLLLVLTSAACTGRLGGGPGSSGVAPLGTASPEEPFVARWKGKTRVGDESRGFRLGLLGAPPDRFVLEISGPVGGTVLQVAHDGDRLRVLFPRERVFLDEPAAPSTVERLVGFPLAPEVLLAVLLGRMHTTPFPDTPVGGTDLQEPPGSIRLGPDGWPREGSITVPGRAPVQIRYERFTGTSAGVLPREVYLHWESGDLPLRVRLVLRTCRSRSVPGGDPFRLPAPPRFRRVTLDRFHGDGPILFSEVKGTEP